MAAIAVGVDAGDGFFVELGEEDVGDGVVDGFGCVFEEVGEADVETAFAQADGGVEGGKAAETNVERGIGARGRSSRYCCSKTATRDVGAGNFFARGFLERGGWSVVAWLSWKRVGGGAGDGEKSCRN